MSDIIWHKLTWPGPRNENAEPIACEDVVLYKLVEDGYTDYYIGDGQDYWSQHRCVHDAVAYAIVRKDNER